MDKKIKQFNIVMVGTGGQGLITLLQIVAQASLTEGYDLRTSELHGLSQRGGSVEAHARFGKEIYSPLIPRGKADLIIALEMQESLRTIHFANPKTVFLINKYIIPIPLEKPFAENQALKALKKITKKIKLVKASDICQKEFGVGVTSGIYLLSLASFKKILPLKPNSILEAIKKVIPEQYLELNQKTFNLVKKYGKK